ncbi:MAG: hypothetical protein F4Z06_06540 [Acidimicrobiia bacterium]|nr:hypothetical protein [Acidimicrobiia bacterium]MYE73545.1 hypothetical protein [Acidimicrobiia bacterium]
MAGSSSFCPEEAQGEAHLGESAAETLVRHFEAADDARTLVADIADTVGTVRVVLDGSGINPTIELD